MSWNLVGPSLEAVEDMPLPSLELREKVRLGFLAHLEPPGKIVDLERSTKSNKPKGDRSLGLAVLTCRQK